ncbi:MAG: response regulator [Proteobacteria bacterium]|nr:response regulator [Pseudomonadota bacterium]
MSLDILKKRVLIVDDYRTMLRIIGNLLRQLGFENIEEATDGQAALEVLAGSQIDFILSDWNMEPMSGLELLKNVRSNERTKNIPFIMITAESKAENVIAAKQAGVNNYIVKPFNAVTLKQKLASVLGDF